MPKEYSRSQRVVEQIRRELAELIRLEVKDPRVGFITLTDVEITPDYAHAKVFFTNMTGEGDVPEILQGLRRASGSCAASSAAASASTPSPSCTSTMTVRWRRARACRS
jgi:ribosome-binding factor A